MNFNPNDYIGKKINHLSIKEYIFDEKRRVNRFICECDCGKIVERKRYIIVSGKCFSCGCKLTGCVKKGSEFITENIMSSLWNKLKAAAKERGLEFSITPEYLDNLWVSQNGLCYYSGYPITLPDNNTDAKSSRFTASLDRIDSCSGYIEQNICWVHKNINLMKCDFPEDRFIELCIMITQYRKSLC